MDIALQLHYAPAMPTAPAALILDFLDWLAAGPKPYAETMEAWRTNCPRLTVWEDAVDAGYVARRQADGVVRVELTAAGLRALALAGRRAA